MPRYYSEPICKVGKWKVTDLHHREATLKWGYTVIRLSELLERNEARVRAGYWEPDTSAYVRPKRGFRRPPQAQGLEVA